jgi:hypothetical protein
LNNNLKKQCKAAYMKNLIKKSILKKLIYIKLKKTMPDPNTLYLAIMLDPYKIYWIIIIKKNNAWLHIFGPNV